jgi:hypothetical protein
VLLKAICAIEWLNLALSSEKQWCYQGFALVQFRLRLCESAKVKFTIVRTGSSFYFSSLKTLSKPLYCAFFAYFEVVFLLH